MRLEVESGPSLTSPGQRLSLGKLGFTFYDNFETTAPESENLILMNNSRIGFFSINPFEYPDYTIGNCLVAHFDDSPVSLSYRDKLGLFYLLPYIFEGPYQSLSPLTGSVFFSNYRNIKGNINGGIGYWAGYGISTSKIEFE